MRRPPGSPLRRSLALALLALAACGGNDQPAPAAPPNAERPAAQPPAPASSPGPAATTGADPGTAAAPTRLAETPPAVANAPEPVADESTPAPEQGAETGRQKKRDGGNRVAPRSGGGTRTARGAEARIALVEGEPAQHSFGKVRQGESVGHDFELVAEGELPLRITLVKPTCGCQTHVAIVLLGADGTRTAYEYNQEIAPGTRFVLETRSTTEDVSGAFQSTLQVFSNAKGPPFALVLTGESEPILIARPGLTFGFGQVTTADVAERTITVASTGGEPFALRLVNDAVLALAKVELVPLAPGADGRAAEWEVRARLGPNAPIGSKRWRVILETDLVRKAATAGALVSYHGLELGLEAEVIGAFRADPTFVSFGIVKPGEAAEQEVRIESAGQLTLPRDAATTIEDQAGQAFRLADLLEVAFEPAEDGRTGTLSVSLKGLPAATEGSFGGLLRLQLGPPEVEPLVLRIYGTCRADGGGQ